MFRIKVLILKMVGNIMKFFGKGSSIVGFLDTKLKFNVLKNINLEDKEVIFVVGTNGKTTITNTLNKIYKKENKKVLSNIEGANMLNGIKNTLIMDIENKSIKSDILILEVDEKSLKHVAKLIKPKHILITNFFRDQLDRYFEISLIIEEIVESIKEYKPKVYFNGEDPLIDKYLKDVDVEQIKYRLNQTKLSKLEQKNIIEIKYCPNCKNALNYNYYHYSHIGDFFCPKCDFKVDKISYEFDVLKGQLFYNGKILKKIENDPIYLIINYCLISSFCLENKINLSVINKSLSSLTEIGGRNNIINYNNKDIYLNLAKNVVGMEQTIEFLKRENDIDLLIAFNDNYADGKDVSWIWDVDFESIIPKINNLYLVGLRKQDMALRFLYSDIEENKIKIFTNVEEAIEEVSKLKNPKIISNYTPLAEIRNFFKNKGV